MSARQFCLPALHTYSTLIGFTMLLRSVVALALFIVSLSASAAYRNNIDLISLHYDHAPDRDDGHATVAALMVVTKFGIQPHVVSGAYGQHNDHRYQPPAEQVMQATWGNNWLNAHSNWQNSVNRTATRWIQTINAGGDVYVAEGGQADFTADVVREIRRQTSINTKTRITVVQHSAWNERMANASDLAYVRAQTDYVKINDGNNENGTADLNKRSDSFVAAARSGQFSDQWNAAFDYLSPSSKLDFSDTVELLHILDVGKNIVATVNDFGDEYFNSTPTPAVTNNGPQNWSDSYSVDGQCFCDTTYDHGIGNVQVSTPDGNKSVRQICQDISSTFGSGSSNNRVYYNTVQCGHGPANSAADEQVCPGIPNGNNNYTGPNCNNTGATWNLDALYPTPVVVTPTEPPVEQPTVDPLFPVCSALTVDDNLDGYAWENNQTCIVDSQLANPQPAVTPDVFPVCSIAIVDEDGDGYAWENNQTCEVTTTDAGLVTQPDNPEAPLFPACSALAQDSDGDGYAWENNQTCAIAQATTIPAGPEFPECSTQLLDTDSDGYGWENNQTCAFSTATASSEAPVTFLTFPSCSANIVDNDADGYGWENNQTCAFDAAPSGTPKPQLAEITFPACSAALTDTDADGYGWENNQSCYFDQTGNQSSDAFDQSTVTIINFPSCSNTIQDHDSDGYGWENNQTCQMPDNSGQTDPSPLAFVTFPACSNQLTDNDGDGYGWENNQSCAFDQTAPSTIDSTGSETVTITGIIYRVCSPAVVDDNNDGFAWENNTTCVVSANIPTLLEISDFPVCSVSVVDQNLDGYGWENNSSCRIAN